MSYFLYVNSAAFTKECFPTDFEGHEFESTVQCLLLNKACNEVFQRGNRKYHFETAHYKKLL